MRTRTHLGCAKLAKGGDGVLHVLWLGIFCNWQNVIGFEWIEWVFMSVCIGDNMYNINALILYFCLSVSNCCI